MDIKCKCGGKLTAVKERDGEDGIPIIDIVCTKCRQSIYANKEYLTED